ncbi:helix-turn-helix domain-containing protein [Entomomonas sp. E2T0]|uniref:helix-turn-helix domain-containing protein n=1 Tax=Entomomonas sp. E2T0 TaxID=2930213 RepID=UPI00222845E5|nr:helix-turn-helix domain-containing protein [Entomomonas sp. E2T0]UYZ84700.1 helix-turn-helix domain-containing protein [Entomomonas sp. E2T0]
MYCQILAETFGNRLKEERVRLDLTQEELAEKTGIRAITIIQYEKGKSSPPIKFIYSLQDLGFDIAYLLTSTTNIPNPSDFPPELFKEIGSAIDQFELHMEANLTNEEKAKLILIMLKQYMNNINQGKPSNTIQMKDILSNLLRLA